MGTNEGKTDNMLVYTSDHSLYCAKLRILLRHKKLHFTEAPPPGGGGSAEYLSHVPSGNIPALIDGDMSLTDSEAIAEYLEEKHPNIPMLPSTLIGRAKSRERSRFSDTRLEPALRLTFPHVDPAARNTEAINAAHTLISKHLVALAQLLNCIELPRENLWMGDPGTIVTLEWIDLFDGVVFPTLDWPTEVQKYRADMYNHAAVAAELEAYRPAMHTYMRQKNVTSSKFSSVG
ncbi:MAG: glutathione S-transferase family protein [Roseobacter sp.]